MQHIFAKINPKCLQSNIFKTTILGNKYSEVSALLSTENHAPRKKNGFVTATELGTTNNFFVAATKNFAAATKRFVDRTKHFVVVTKYFCYPYFNK